VDDKTTINALIKGLTPGPTASHLKEKYPWQSMNFPWTWRVHFVWWRSLQKSCWTKWSTTK
jgi:hypothetical protein